jgi:hypothetical protein
MGHFGENHDTVAWYKVIGSRTRDCKLKSLSYDASAVDIVCPRLVQLNFFLIPFYLQAVQIHSANGVKLLEA